MELFRSFISRVNILGRIGNMKYSPLLPSNPLYIRVRSTEGTFCIDLGACVETWEGPKVRERCIIQGTDPQDIATEWNFVNFSTEVGGKAGN